MRKLEDAQLPAHVRDAILAPPDLSTAENCRKYLERLAAEVRSGIVWPATANSLTMIVAEIRKIAELQLQAQIADIEARLGGRP